METEDTDFQKLINIFNVEDLQTAGKGYLDNYFGIGENPTQFFETFELLNFTNEQGDEEPQVIMDIFYLPGIKVNQSTPIRHVFTSDDYGIFEKREELRSAVRRSKYFTMTYHLTNTIPFGNINSEE